jgi:hypothetical protein
VTGPVDARDAVLRDDTRSAAVGYLAGFCG